MNSRAAAGPRDVDLGTVDLLARLRLHTGLRVRRPTRELHELLDLCGLVDVLCAGRVDGEGADTQPENRDCLRQPLGEPEEREELGRVEEEGELGYPPA